MASSPVKGGTVTMSKHKLYCLLMMALCIGVTLNELFPLFSTNPRGSFLVSNQRSVESIQVDSAMEALANQKSAQQNITDDTYLGGGAFDPGSTYPYNRTITLIHLGKTGGSSVRSASKVQCRFQKDPQRPKRIMRRTCAVNPLMPQNKVPTIGKMVQDVFHMWGFNQTLLPLVSTYLMTIRHPVERVVSSYRYSHPGNCLPELIKKVRQSERPWGCQLIKNEKIYKPRSVAHRLYSRCFPRPQIEDFAQSLGSPWASNPHFETNLTDHQCWECRQLARALVRGSTLNQGAAPHMQYNYQYYWNWTLRPHHEKEVLVVRTEQQWDDLVAIDKMVGGDGNFFRNQGKHVSYGSSNYQPSPLSSEGNQKLCCILADEIELYLQILDRAANLSPSSKEYSLQTVYDSCGIVVWKEWKTSCKKKVLQDDATVERQFAASMIASPKDLMENADDSKIA